MKCPTCCEETSTIRVVSFLHWCALCGSMIDAETNEVRVPQRSPFAQSQGLPFVQGEFAPGLLLVAAAAINEANRRVAEIRETTKTFWDPATWPKFREASLHAIESATEAISATLEELNAQREDFAEFIVAEGERRPADDPERLRDLLARTLRRRKVT